MKTLIVTHLSLCLSIVCFAQVNQALYRPYKDKADSIVTRFLGQHVFEHYVALDSGKSQYRATVNDRTRATTFREVLKFNPALFVFHYTFKHPRLKDETFRINFALDSAGQFLVNEETYGLIHTLDLNDTTIVSKEQALEICKAQSHSLKKNSLRLAWNNHTVDYDNFRHNGNLASLWTGRMVWQVQARVKFRGKMYDGTLAVDVLTGQVMRVFPELPWD